MKDPTRGIGTNDFAEMSTQELINLHVKLDNWIEELRDQNWENDNHQVKEQIDNEWDYIHELFKPELEAELNRRAAARRGKS